MENKDKKLDKHILRALINPSEEGSDYDFIAMAIPAENKQLRRNNEADEYYYEILKTAPENMKTARLDSGLPLFDNHPYDLKATEQLGITIAYEFKPEGLEVKCKFGARADQALRDDVKNGIVKTVSIEGDIEELTIERKAGEIPIYYATMWEPTSLSFAPVPQDISAQIDVKRAIEKQIQKTEIKPKSQIELLINKF